MQPTLEMIESQLMLGNVETAGRLLDLMAPESSRNQASSDERYWGFKQVLRRLESCNSLARAGEFEHAAAELAALESLCPNWALLDQKRRSLAEQQQKLCIELERMWAAQASGAWAEAAIAAHRAQDICPQLPIARLMREKQRSTPQINIAPQGSSHQTQAWRGNHSAKASISRRKGRVTEESGSPQSERVMIWIDGVGGYLACLAPIVTIGQAIPGSHIDIPLQADISRRHAILRRMGEGYAIDPLHTVKVNEKAITEPTYLLDGDEISLGEKVRLRFVKRNSLSATARLDFLSRHRTSPSADGILLMAESLVLGPQSKSHVLCRDWPAEVVLFRRKEGFGCHSVLPLSINGQAAPGKPLLPIGAHLGGEGFSVTIEKLL